MDDNQFLEYLDEVIATAEGIKANESESAFIHHAQILQDGAQSLRNLYNARYVPAVAPESVPVPVVLPSPVDAIVGDLSIPSHEELKEGWLERAKKALKRLK